MDHLKGSESENPMTTCLSLLSLRRFSACCDFARRLPPTDTVARVLTIANILSAADFYSVLQLHPSDCANRDLVRRQYVKLALLLDPTSPDKFPFSDEALARVQEAWHVLSRPERRALYDREHPVPETATFWSACPYCWNLFEYEKRYEDCALLCQVCGKAFQGVAVIPPSMVGEAVVEGEELRQYYSCVTTMPLRYYEVKEEIKGSNTFGEQNAAFGEQNAASFVDISDDDDNEVFVTRNEGLQGNDEKRRMRVKTVAKKGSGNRRRRRSLDSDSDLDFDLGEEDDELEFTEGDDDVFVGVRFRK